MPIYIHYHLEEETGLPAGGPCSLKGPLTSHGSLYTLPTDTWPPCYMNDLHLSKSQSLVLQGYMLCPGYHISLYSCTWVAYGHHSFALPLTWGGNDSNCSPPRPLIHTGSHQTVYIGNSLQVPHYLLLPQCICINFIPAMNIIGLGGPVLTYWPTNTTNTFNHISLTDR